MSDNEIIICYYDENGALQRVLKKKVSILLEFEGDYYKIVSINCKVIRKHE